MFLLLSLPSAGITGVYHHAQLLCVFKPLSLSEVSVKATNLILQKEGMGRENYFWN
jgi:hypothetical protein